MLLQSLICHRFPIPEREFIRNKNDATAPYRTPALIGCAIAIDREFFFEIGSFDMGMDIWGGENTELSLRVRQFIPNSQINQQIQLNNVNLIRLSKVWQCGGALEIVPCSRVGHYFRLLPYTFNNDDKQAVKIRNNIRIAEVWMDEYKPYFELFIPSKLQPFRLNVTFC